MIFVDESEFVPERLWTNTILPLNMQTKTSLLAATTPQDNTTFHAALLNLIDPSTGKPVFNVVNLVEVCPKCLLTDKPWKCTHRSDQISGSKSQYDRDITLLMFRNAQSTAVRELFGQQTQSKDNLLQDEWIERFYKSSATFEHSVRALYMGVDPGGGGSGQMGVCVIAEVRPSPADARLAVSFSVSTDLFFFFIQIHC